MQKAHNGGRESCLLLWFNLLLPAQLLVFNTRSRWEILNTCHKWVVLSFSRSLPFMWCLHSSELCGSAFEFSPMCGRNRLFKGYKCSLSLLRGAASERTSGSAEEVTHIWISAGHYRMRVQPQLGRHGVTKRQMSTYSPEVNYTAFAIKGSCSLCVWDFSFEFTCQSAEQWNPWLPILHLQ